MKTEDQLIQKTITIIDQDGYENLSLRSLTNKLNLTTGAFYKHFSNKEDLFCKTAQYLSKSFIQSISVDKQMTPEQQLLQIAYKLCIDVTQHPNRIDFLFFNPAVNKVYHQADNQDFVFLNRVKNLIHQVNINKHTSEQQLFIQVWAFIQGYAYLIKNGITKYDSAIVTKTLEQFLKG